MNLELDEQTKALWNKANEIFLSTLNTDEEKNQAERYLNSVITSISKKGNELEIHTSSSYASELLQQNYAVKLKSCLMLAGDTEDLKLNFLTDENKRTRIIVPETKIVQEKKAENLAQKAFVSTMPLKEDYTFDEFVTGLSNSWAYAAAKGAAKEPGKKGLNPLFIHGGTGLGKTHLMQAIGNDIKKKNPMASVCYLTAERFLNDYVNHVSNHTMQQFQDRYRKVDVLLVDDVQFLNRGKESQQEFFNTFNALLEDGKQIVMTSDVAPKDLPGIEVRLISRFEWGNVQEIEAPSYETRLAILKKKNESLEYPVKDEVIKYIATNIKSHVRAMEGALAKIEVMVKYHPEIEINEEVLDYALKDFIEKEKSRKKVSIQEIQIAVAKKYSISLSQILSKEKTANLVTPRQLAMYIARKFTSKSLPDIAHEFDKTHATIVHGVKTISKRLDVEIELKETLISIISEFGYSMDDRIG